MKKYFLLITLLISSLISVNAQHLLKDSILAHYNKTQVDSIINTNGLNNPLIQANYSIGLHRILYSTINAKGTDTTVASGLLVVPDSVQCPMPIAVYNHGTVLQRNGVPSRLSTEALLGIIFSLRGYYAILPDYLGLGDSPGFHPYIHAKSEATATIDMIKACQQLAANDGIMLNGQLFLTGYSQGGHACMATHREIQLYHPELAVTASAPNSGPYNVSGVQAQTIVNNNVYADPSYLPYIIFSYQSVYGNLYGNGNIFDSLQQIFNHPYDSILPGLFDETHGTGDVDNYLPHHPDSIVTANQLNLFLTDTLNNPLRKALKDNDVFEWVPNAPMKMTYCEADEQVFYHNALVAYNYFTTHGDTTVQAVSGGASNSHINCVSPAITNTILFFEGLRKFENNLNVTLQADSESVPGAGDAGAKVVVTGGIGYSIQWSTGSTDSVITGLHDGTYSVTITDANGCTKTRSINTLGTTTGINNNYTTSVQLKAYPVPANNELYYEIQSTKQGHYYLDLTNMQGQKLIGIEMDINGTGNYGTLDINHLSNGIYCLRLSSETNSIIKRIVVAR